VSHPTPCIGVYANTSGLCAPPTSFAVAFTYASTTLSSAISYSVDRGRSATLPLAATRAISVAMSPSTGDTICDPWSRPPR
jgi:hypothetical protein